MQHFKIFEPGEYTQEPIKHTLFAVGTQLTFHNVAGQLKASIRIPVQFA